MKKSLPFFLGLILIVTGCVTDGYVSVGTMVYYEPVPIIVFPHYRHYPHYQWYCPPPIAPHHPPHTVPHRIKPPGPRAIVPHRVEPPRLEPSRVIPPKPQPSSNHSNEHP